MAVELGVLLGEESPDLDALFIRQAGTGELVTVIELISPSHKSEPERLNGYKMRRAGLLAAGVQVMELDFTHSTRRMVSDALAHDYPYQVLIHLNPRTTRLVGVALDAPLPRVAVPLRQEALALALHPVYQASYQQTQTAAHIQQETSYALSALPLKSDFSPDALSALQAAIVAWQAEIS